LRFFILILVCLYQPLSPSPQASCSKTTDVIVSLSSPLYCFYT
jgi:hypothetical protein